MPTQVMNDSDSSGTEIKVKTAYNGEVMITYINARISYDELCAEMRGICRFSPDQVSSQRGNKNIFEYVAQQLFSLQVFTMKWVDEEGDPCTISSQIELAEAIRLYEINKESELVIHGEFVLLCFSVPHIAG